MQNHTSHLVRKFFIALSLAAVCLTATAVIIGVADQDRTSIKRVPGAAPPSVSAVVYLTVAPGMMPASDGTLHDAYSTTNVNVRVGQPVKLVVNNTDDVPHGIEAEAAGVNLSLKPGKHTYTLLVSKAGKFAWHCEFPCDPWSMAHDGYMRGVITATA
jgi:plastocyanin